MTFAPIPPQYPIDPYSDVFKKVAPVARQIANQIAKLVRTDAEDKEKGVDTGTYVEEKKTTYRKTNPDGTRTTTTTTERTVTV